MTTSKAGNTPTKHIHLSMFYNDTMKVEDNNPSFLIWGKKRLREVRKYRDGNPYILHNKEYNI